MKISEKISLFEPRTEKIFLFLPLVFMALIPFEFLFFKDIESFKDGLLSEIVLNTVFLNVTHVALTYIMLFSFPEMRRWIARRSAGGSFRFWLKNTLIFSGFFLFFLIPYLHTSKDWVFLIFILVTGQAPFHHAIYQVRGLSACYSQAIAATGLSEAERQRLRASEFMEKYFFHLFFGVSLILRLYFSTQQVPDFFNRSFALINFNLLQIFCLSSLGLLFVFLIYILRNMPKSAQSNKGLYLLRLLAFPLGQFSALAAWASVLIHGTEYLCLFLKMTGKSTSANKKTIVRLAVAVLVLFGLIYASLRVWLYSLGPDRSDVPLFLALLSTAITALTFLHYYLDRILFRMRDPLTRENIAPLVI
jgi:hypothetical protein